MELAPTPYAPPATAPTAGTAPPPPMYYPAAPVPAAAPPPQYVVAAAPAPQATTCASCMIGLAVMKCRDCGRPICVNCQNVVSHGGRRGGTRTVCPACKVADAESSKRACVYVLIICFVFFLVAATPAIVLPIVL
eukprot:TRINITY_DN3372_c0_g1_i1.p2 TRINITY_DN3372_c0_g1~~TRINITY_DN3372_c0_g1_i1.p2  ORF type:complete len:135 (-),score=26.83 TRINITY_DN3372_c0_g1_i1:86-490(-)